MDEVNTVQGAESAAASSPAVETKVDSGSAPEKVFDTRTALEDAKTRLLDRHKGIAPEAKPADAEGTGKAEETQPIQAKKDKPQDDLASLQRAFEKKKQDINKLLSQKHSLTEQNAKLQAEIEKFTQRKASEPKPEDFPDANAYNRAKIRYDMDMETGAERIQNADTAIAEQRNAEWHDRCKTVTKDFEKFADKYAQNYDWLLKNEKELMGYASESVVGPRLIEEAFDDLFANRDNYAKWRGMNPMGKQQLLAQLEHKLVREMNTAPNHQPETPRQKSSAPAPITPEKVSEQIAPKTLSTADQLAKYRQRLLNR